MKKPSRESRQTPEIPARLEPDNVLRSLKEGNILIACVGFMDLRTDTNLPDDLFNNPDQLTSHRILISECRQKAIMLNAIASTDKIYIDKFTSVLAKACGLVTDKEHGDEHREVFCEAAAQLAKLERFYKLLGQIEDGKLRGELAEVVGDLAVLAARLSKYDRVSAPATDKGRSRSAPGRVARSRAAENRRDRIRGAVFNQFDADCRKSDGQIAVMLIRDFFELYPIRDGKPSEKTPKRDVKALRKEWEARR
jgi:hypothetical protein